ncbi:porphobilinogen synthase [Treponema primitia ZAS-2]|uniref:Delta-aminolevulinic acid dehydratase n=1 Tax=Treponema primitia (strain ATCC BAA-887 / DSM 12427 / ZAS-2) TaxID=545694 RepID=F5YLI4_TREPZ|nr:porphobilinogen synthase [Treponema primitia]AEF86389.1 porphobilinogen synthase [Treponema primitia ZAS-2]
MDLTERPRRLRANEGLRSMVMETRVSKNALVYPLFIREGQGIVEDIPSLDGQKRCTPDKLPFLLEEPVSAGVRSILLFGLPDHKDETGSSAWDENGPVQRAVREAKRAFPELTVITDVCLCEYTSHGHCGVIKDGIVQNDETLPLLAKTALSHVRSGADIVAPSDMMDGRVGAIRSALDSEGFEQRAIMSYAVKYASAFYGPFRDAAGSAPAFGDRKGYQMDPHNAKEALREARLDTEEGADILIVKPALPYLDILYRVASDSLLPVAAYSVSGEYAMLRAAAKAGLLDEPRVVSEATISIFRAGARILITYYAPQLARWIDEGRLDR